MHFWEVFAARKCKELKPARSRQVRRPLSQETDRNGPARMPAVPGETTTGPDARAKASDIVALYADDSDLKELVDKASAILKDLASKPGSPGRNGLTTRVVSPFGERRGVRRSAAATVPKIASLSFSAAP